MTDFARRNLFTLKKTASYYVMHIVVAAAVAYAVTGELFQTLEHTEHCHALRKTGTQAGQYEPWSFFIGLLVQQGDKARVSQAHGHSYAVSGAVATVSSAAPVSFLPLSFLAYSLPSVSFSSKYALYFFASKSLSVPPLRKWRSNTRPMA